MKPIDEVVSTIKLKKGTIRILKEIKEQNESYDQVIKRFIKNG